MSMKMSARGRHLAIAGIGAAVALALTACAPPGGSAPAPAPSSSEAGGEKATGTVKIGFIAPVSGPIAAVGQQMQDGWQYYWEENGYEVGGVTVDMVGYEDDAGDVQKAVTAATKLVEQLGAEIVVGPLAANTASAVSAYTTEQEVVNIAPVAASNDLTSVNWSPFTIRAGSMAATQNNYPAGEWAATDLGAKTALTICTDYSFGWESCAGFVQGFTQNGGEVIEQIWTPNGDPDYSAYVSTLVNSPADVIYFGSAGGLYGPNFLETYLGAGGDIDKLLLNCCASDQATLVVAEQRGLADQIVGLKSVSYWAEGEGAPPAAQEFVESWAASHDGQIAGAYIAGGYFAASMVAKVFEEYGLLTGEDLVSKIQSFTFEDSIFGPVRWDQFNNPVQDVFIREVGKNSDGKLVNNVIKTYEGVEQFIGMDPEEFNAMQPFTKDNQGL